MRLWLNYEVQDGFFFARRDGTFFGNLFEFGWTPRFETFPGWKGVSRLTLPLAIPYVIVATPTLFAWFRRKYRRGHCQQCGYDLTGNESGVCPECGSAVSEEKG